MKHWFSVRRRATVIRWARWNSLSRRWRYGIYASLGGGVALFALSALLSSAASASAQWWSNALLNIGSSIFLFVPLLVVTEWLFSRRIGRIENQASIDRDRVENVQSRLESLAQLVDPALRNEAANDLDIEVRARLASTREDDEELFARLGVLPTREGLRAAVLRAVDLGLLSASGGRTELLPTAQHVRFSVEEPAVSLVLELGDGTSLGQIEWVAGERAIEVLEKLALLSRSSSGFEGERFFFPGHVFRQFSDMLLFALRNQFSVTGDTGVDHLVEMTNDGWILSDTAIRPRSYLTYEIAVRRLDEIDWSEHISNKGWPEAAAFPHTLQWARPLLENRSK